MSQFGGVDEALSLAVECLERFHKVGERADVGFRVDGLEDGQNLLELVLLLACTQPCTTSYTVRHRHHH